MNNLSFVIAINSIFLASFFVFQNILLSIFLVIIALFFHKPANSETKAVANNEIMSTVKTKPKFVGFLPQAFLNIKLNNNSLQQNSLISLLLFIFLDSFFGYKLALFMAFFIFSFLNKLKSEVSYILALIFISINAFFNMLNSPESGNDPAIMAFFFIVIGIIWQVYEYRADPQAELETEENQDSPIFQFSFNNTSLKPYTLLFTVTIISGILLSAGYFLLNNIKTNQISKTNQTQPPKKTKIKYPLTVLNGSETKGLADSAATLLKSKKWDENFIITIGNADNSKYMNTILKYTPNLKSEIPKLAHDLDLELKTTVIGNSSNSGELILILGKY